MPIETALSSDFNAAISCEKTAFNGDVKNISSDSNKAYLTAEDVPDQYKEPNIYLYYRKPGSSAIECVASLFQYTNETVNFWSHFLILVYLAVYFWLSWPECSPPGSVYLHSYCYPLMYGAATILLYHSMSCAAHVFCSMSPRIRHICFYLDYGAISIFSIGSALIVSAYMMPTSSGIKYFESTEVYMITNIAVSLLACGLSCATRHRWKEWKYIVRTVAFTLPFFTSNLPLQYRAALCTFDGRKECAYSLVFSAKCWMYYLFGAIFNVVRFPETSFPGRFDFIGQSHHWVHLFTSLGTYEVYKGALSDLVLRWPTTDEAMQAEMTGAIWYVAVSFGTILAMVLWFGSQLTSSGDLKRSRIKKDQ